MSLYRNNIQKRVICRDYVCSVDAAQYRWHHQRTSSHSRERGLRYYYASFFFLYNGYKHMYCLKTFFLKVLYIHKNKKQEKARKDG